MTLITAGAVLLFGWFLGYITGWALRGCHEHNGKQPPPH